MSDWVTDDVIYLHIPKTGGNWVRSVLKKSGVRKGKSNRVMKHATYDLLVGAGPTKYGLPLMQRNTTRKFFCVVRHPLLWYQSWFRYQHDHGWKRWGESGNLHPKNWHCLSPLNMEKTPDFNEFMSRINRDCPGFLTYLYHSFALPSNARVLKNEQLRDDLLAINEDWSLGLDTAVIERSDKVNVSNKLAISWSEENLHNTMLNEKGALQRYAYDQPPESLVEVR